MAKGNHKFFASFMVRCAVAFKHQTRKLHHAKLHSPLFLKRSHAGMWPNWVCIVPWSSVVAHYWFMDSKVCSIIVITIDCRVLASMHIVSVDDPQMYTGTHVSSLHLLRYCRIVWSPCFRVSCHNCRNGLCGGKVCMINSFLRPTTTQFVLPLLPSQQGK